MTVEAIMTRDVVSIGPRASVREAIRMLEDCEIRHLPVVEEQRLIGIVSDRDLRDYRAPLQLEGGRFDEQANARFNQMLDTPVIEAMIGDPLCVEMEDSIASALDAMLEYKVGALPVVERDSDELVGIVSYVDVLRYARRLLQEDAS